MFASFFLLRQDTAHSAARTGYQAMLGVEFAVLVILVFLLRGRLHRDMQAYEAQYELLGAQNERLRDNERLLGSILDSSPLAIIAMDAELNVLLWNRSAETLFGWAADEVLGRLNPIT